MLLTLHRTLENAVSTVGTIIVDANKLHSATLEDAFHDPKIAGETRIPAGTYDLKLRTDGGMQPRYLKRFGPDFHHGMIWLQDVPGFQFVYIHIGNDPDDTEGCILVGLNALEPKRVGAPYRLGESEKAYRQLYPIVSAAIRGGERCAIEVRNPKSFVGV